MKKCLLPGTDTNFASHVLLFLARKYPFQMLQLAVEVFTISIRCVCVCEMVSSRLI